MRILGGLVLAMAMFAASPPMAQPSPAVVVAEAAMAPVSLGASFTGRAVAPLKVELRARVTGFLTARSFEEGGQVTEGEVLFEIEPEAYRAVLAEAEAAIAAAQARLALAAIERDRQATLVDREVVAQAELDRAEAELAADQAEVARLTAQRDRAALDLSYTQVIAPFAGRIGLSSVDVGALVGPETGVLATLVATDPMTVEFPVPERRLLAYQAALQAGDGPQVGTARLTLSDDTLYPEPGRIDFTDIAVAPGTDTVMVRAVFPNPREMLRDGALVRVELEADEQQTALVVPQQAMQRDLGGHFVLVVDDSNTVALRRVTLERQTGGMAVIAAGLEAGERVIVEGINKVRPGITVDAATAEGG